MTTKTDLVWITGCPAAGKTFLGDVFSIIQTKATPNDEDPCNIAWIHVDGDEEINVHPTSDTTEGLQKAFNEYWFKDEEAPCELWHPYYKQVCDKVKGLRLNEEEEKGQQYVENRKQRQKIVISLALYRHVVREYVREQLGEPITFICLQVATSEYLHRMLDKLDSFLRGSGMSRDEFWKAQKFEEQGFGLCTPENIEAFYLSPKGGGKYLCGLQSFTDDEYDSGLCHDVDTANHHRDVIPKVSKILGLVGVNGQLTEDEVKHIANMNLERHAKYKELREKEQENRK